MSKPATFTEHVQDVLCDAYRVPHWTPEEAEKYMAEYGVHRQRFEQLAYHLDENIEHDVRFEKLIVHIRTRMMPGFCSHFRC